MLTYKAVGAPIGVALPTSVVLGTAWWTGKHVAHVRAWRALGWVAHASPGQRRVRFARDAEGA